MRVEYKYLLTKERYLDLKCTFDLLLSKDNYSKKGSYDVSSVYYDTENLEYYYDKANGEYKHTKMRLRTYGKEPFSGPTYFEYKIKENEDQYKRRIRFTELMSLWDVPSYVAEKDLDFFDHMPADLLVPTCHVFYKREAYFAGSGEKTLRLNFDSDIMMCRPGKKFENESVVFPDGHVVLEVKTPTREFFPLVKDLLSDVPLMRTTFSKYATGVNVLGYLNGGNHGI